MKKVIISSDMCFQQQEVDKLRLHGLSGGKEALVEVVVSVMPLQGIVNAK